MIMNTDAFRFHIEEYLEKHGCREAAIYLLLFVKNKIVNERGLFELAYRLKLQPTGTLPYEFLYQYGGDFWRIQYVRWHPRKIRCFECVQRIAHLLLNEKTYVLDDPKNPYFKEIGYIDNTGLPYEFALEYCMPTPMFLYFARTKFSVDELAEYMAVDSDVMADRLTRKHLDESVLNRIFHDFTQYTGYNVKLDRQSFLWAEYSKA